MELFPQVLIIGSEGISDEELKANVDTIVEAIGSTVLHDGGAVSEFYRVTVERAEDRKSMTVRVLGSGAILGYIKEGDVISVRKWLNT
ncbi:MAG TPA: hypothetical protein VIH76_07425 [Candidatus Acidoferrales bacterium]